MAISSDVFQPLGSRFRVQPASDLIALGEGWLVTDRETGNYIWTGGWMTLLEARNRLIEKTL